MRCGCGQLQCTCGVSLSQRQTSEAFQRPRDTTPVPQTREDFQGFAVCGVCSQMISLLTVDVAQIGQRSRGTPSVSGFPKGGKRTLIQSSRGSHIALFARYVALLVDRPGGAAAIAEFLKNVRRFTQAPIERVNSRREP